jgi:hypothetical protein
LPPGSAAPADTQEMKEGPGGEAGAFKEKHPNLGIKVP